MKPAMILLLLAPLALLGTACGDDDSDDGNPDAGDPDGGGDTDSDTGDQYDPAADCAELGLPTVEFVDADSSTALYATAADFTVPTTAGDLTLSQWWSGCDVYLVIPDSPNQVSTAFGVAIWEQELDVQRLFERLPLNARVLFVSDKVTEDGIAESLEGIQGSVAAALDTVPDADRQWWERRVHYVTTRSGDLEGWLGDILTSPAWGVGIDREQRIRYLGSFADPTRYDAGIGWFGPNVSMMANEAIFYNYEIERDAELIDADDTVVQVFANDNATEDNFYATVELPDAETMAGFDTMLYDLYLGCIGDGEFGDCPEWDYLVYLYLCDDETPESCTTEVGRWITTYHREGRWVHDVSALLPLFVDGGTKYLRFSSSNDYELHLDIRLANRGKEVRAVEAIPLWAGQATFDTAYNDNYAEVIAALPADAERVELVTAITGHGMSMPGNCAEFCNTEHYFYVNDEMNLLDNPIAGNTWGCQDQVADGTIPNQYGTWWYGRNGWCPGKHVPLISTDITEQVVLGSENTFDYEAFYMGSPYDGDNWRHIVLASWVVVYK